MSSHTVSSSSRSTWKGKARETSSVLLSRANGSGGESGAVLQLEMILIDTYEAVYTIPLIVGDSQNLSVQVDTGSSDLWIASTACNTQACKQAGGRLYDFSRSKPTNQTFEIDYVEGLVNGPIVWDSVQIGGYSVANQALAAATSVDSEPLSGDFSGVLGLALPANSIITTYVPATTGNNPDGAILASNLFSITPDSSAPDFRFLSLTLERPESDAIPSLLGIGRHPDFISDPRKVQYAAVVPTELGFTFWRPNVVDISVWVDGVRKSVNLGASATTGGTPTAVIDSGMPIILTSMNIANAIYGALGIGPASDGQYYLPCSTPINMTVTLDNRSPIPLHPLDLTTPNSDSSCLGLIQAISSSKVSDIADIIFGVPFMRSVYTVMAFDEPDDNGAFPGPSSPARTGIIHPRLGLLGLTNATQALDEFHTVRILNQPLPQTHANQGNGASSHPTAPEPSSKKLSIGVEVLIGLVGFFLLCVSLFGLRWFIQRRRLQKEHANAGVNSDEAKDDVAMKDVAYRMARRSSYGSRYGPSEDTIRARRYQDYMRQSAYTDDTARTRVVEESEAEKFPTDLELGYRPIKCHSDSLSETGSPRHVPATFDVDPMSTLVGSPPLPPKDFGFPSPKSINTADYPSSPPAHHRMSSAEASVAIPLLAHTRNDSHFSLPVSSEENMAGRGRIPLGQGRPASRARVASFDSTDQVDHERRFSHSSVHSRSSIAAGALPTLSFQSRSPATMSRELDPSFTSLLSPPLVNLELQDPSQLSFSVEAANGHPPP